MFGLRKVMEGWCSTTCQTAIGLGDSILYLSTVPSATTAFSGTDGNGSAYCTLLYLYLRSTCHCSLCAILLGYE